MTDTPETKKPEEPKAEEKKKEEKPVPKDNLVETRHSITIGGRELRYTVITGTMVMKEEPADQEKEFEGEKPRASDLLHLLHQGRCRRPIQTPDHVHFQWRSGLCIGMVAHGPARAAPGGAGG